MIELHDLVRKQLYPQDTEKEFVARVCNHGMILPQPKIDGGVYHLPVTKLTGLPQTCKGWRRCSVMIVLGGPLHADIELGRGLDPQTRQGKFMRNQLKLCGYNLDDVLVTHASRFALPEHLKTYASQHKSSCRPYVIADIENCRPKVIITMGADAFKALYGAHAKMTVQRGGFSEYLYSDGSKAVVIPTVTPATFMSGYAGLEVFQEELKRGLQIANGSYRIPTVNRNYRVCRTLQEVRDLVECIRSERPKFIAVDTEFGNDVARAEFGYTLSIQLSWKAGEAACILLRSQTQDPDYYVVKPYGKPLKSTGLKKVKNTLVNPPRRCGIPIYSSEEESKVWEIVANLLNDRSWKLVAHHLRVEADQFYRAGYPIDDRVEDGFDTMLVHHLLHGDEDQGLDDLVRKYTPEYGNYWSALEEWLTLKGETEGMNRFGKKATLRFGYRDIPEELLVPYSLDDAAATFVVAEHLEKELEADATIKNLYWKHVAPTSLHLLDVQRHGILVDENVRMRIRDAYEPIYKDYVQQVRELLNWPEFSPTSKDNIQSALFSDTEYLDKKAAPETARVLRLTPICNTDKYPKMWTDLVKEGKSHLHRPSTKANILELLQQKYPNELVVRLLKYTSVLGKLLSTYLAPITLNEFGVPTDGAGFHQNIGADGRARTHLSQLTETGRYTSKKANLQTNPKKQEAAILEALIWHKFQITPIEYKRRTFDGIKNDDGTWLKESYTGVDFIEESERVHTIPFKDVYIAPPGYSLIEVDFKNAELFVWAYCSGDQNLIDVVDSGRDMHSEVACEAFKLPPLAEMRVAIAELKKGNKAPYKAWNDRFKKEYEAERIAAKTVNFGIMYGRGSNALAAEIQKQGVKITADRCQVIIDGVAKAYPVAWKWLCTNAEFAVANEYVQTAFGRRRYFTGARQMTQSDQAAVQRAAKNSPIQGLVADLLARAGINLYRLRYRTEVGRKLGFKVILPIHDALLVEVLDEQVANTVKALQMCMSSLNPIPGTSYKLSLDVTVMKSWGAH